MSQKARALAAARLIWRVAALPPLRLFILLLAIGSVGASLAGCGSGGNGEKLGERVIPLGQPVPKGGGRYATGVAYKVRRQDRGKRITVQVTGRAPGYESVAKTSAATAPVRP